MNIAAKVWAQAESRSDKTAVRGAKSSLTFADLRTRGRRVAGAAREAGAVPGDRAVLLCPTIPEFPAAYYGLLAAGLVVVPMNMLSTAAEIEYVLQDSGAAVVVAWHVGADAARNAAEQAGRAYLEIADGADFAAEPQLDIHENQPDDTVVLLYTSGTTGRPKGVELTAANLDAAATILLDGFGFTSEDSFATGLPLFHVYGQAAVMNATLAHGGSLSLVSPFSAHEMLETIRRDRSTLLAGVPTMWSSMLQAARDGAPADFSGLRYATSGGAAFPVELLREFRERFGCEILEGYGLTETCSLVATHDGVLPRKAGTVGPAVPGMSIEILGTDGHPVAPGVVGEVAVAGPTVMKGYWGRPDATAEILEGGRLRTGDLGCLDEDGYLSIVGRLKDVIIRGGYNIYPREVEEVLVSHPSVLEVAVVGAPDDHLGEEIVAVVVLRPGQQTTAAELKAWVKRDLAPYKVPRLYHFATELPKGPSGKIVKRDLDPRQFLASAVRG